MANEASEAFAPATLARSAFIALMRRADGQLSSCGQLDRRGPAIAAASNAVICSLATKLMPAFQTIRKVAPLIVRRTNGLCGPNHSFEVNASIGDSVFVMLLAGSKAAYSEVGAFADAVMLARLNRRRPVALELAHK